MRIHRLFSVWYYRPTDMLSVTCMCMRLLPICKRYLLVYWVLSIGKFEVTQYSMCAIIKLLVGIILLHTPPPHCLVWSIISYSIKNCEGFSCKTKLMTGAKTTSNIKKMIDMTARTHNVWHLMFSVTHVIWGHCWEFHDLFLLTNIARCWS